MCDAKIHPEKTLEELLSSFESDKEREEYVSEVRWGKWAKCPFCGYNKTYKFKKGHFKCASKDCKKQFSITVRTLFMGSNLGFKKWFDIFYLYIKTRGRVSSYELCDKTYITPKTEFYARDKIEFCWSDVLRENQSNTQIFDQLIVLFCNSYEKYLVIKNAKYYKNPMHIEDISDIGDPKQYNMLIRHTSYFINVYANWIWCDFASPQDILAETFLWMRDNGIKEYGGTDVVKYVQKTIGRMWYEFLKNHPKYNDSLRVYNKNYKEEGRLNLDDFYIIELIYAKKGNTLTREQIKSDRQLIESERTRIREKRKSQNRNVDFKSHLI